MSTHLYKKVVDGIKSDKVKDVLLRNPLFLVQHPLLCLIWFHQLLFIAIGCHRWPWKKQSKYNKLKKLERCRWGRWILWKKWVIYQETKAKRNHKNGKENQMIDRKKTTGKDSLRIQIERNVSFLDQCINQKKLFCMQLGMPQRKYMKHWHNLMIIVCFK